MEVNIKEYKKKNNWFILEEQICEYVYIDRQIGRDIKIVVIVEKSEQDDEEEKCVYTI